MEKYMNRLVALGILTKNSTYHTLSVMLLTRKITKEMHPAIDCTLCNTYIMHRNTGNPCLKISLVCWVIPNAKLHYVLISRMHSMVYPWS